MKLRNVPLRRLGEQRARIALVVSVLAATLVHSGGAAAETVDYVTPIGNCQVRLDAQGNDRSLTLQPGETRFELWANWIDHVTTRQVIVEDNDPGTVSATIGKKRGGPENLARGCEGKGSVEVTVNSPVNRNANLRRTLRLTSSDRTFDQPVNVINLPAFVLTWDNADGVDRCLTKEPAGSAQFINNNKRLEIRLPPGHASDPTNCVDALRLRAAFNNYNVKVESRAPQFTQIHTVRAVARSPLAQPVTRTNTNLQLNLPAYVALVPPPVLYTVRPDSLTVLDLLPFQQNIVILDLLPLEIRKLTRETVLTINIADPDGNTDSVEMAIFPSNVNGFSAAAGCAPGPVLAGNLLTCRVTFAQPASGVSLVYRLTTAGCFAGEAGQVPYTPTPNDPNGIQPAINISQGATFLDFTLRSVNVGNCAAETPVTHQFESAFSIADMLNHTPGRYTSTVIGMRRLPTN